MTYRRQFLDKVAEVDALRRERDALEEQLQAERRCRKAFEIRLSGIDCGLTDQNIRDLGKACGVHDVLPAEELPSQTVAMANTLRKTRMDRRVSLHDAAPMIGTSVVSLSAFERATFSETDMTDTDAKRLLGMLETEDVTT